jgi:hypothetical protein
LETNAIQKAPLFQAKFPRCSFPALRNSPNEKPQLEPGNEFVSVLVSFVSSVRAYIQFFGNEGQAADEIRGE